MFGTKVAWGCGVALLGALVGGCAPAEDDEPSSASSAEVGTRRRTVTCAEDGSAASASLTIRYGSTEALTVVPGWELSPEAVMPILVRPSEIELGEDLPGRGYYLDYQVLPLSLDRRGPIFPGETTGSVHTDDYVSRPSFTTRVTDTMPIELPELVSGTDPGGFVIRVTYGHAPGDVAAAPPPAHVTLQFACRL
ncbi:MAG: hypothetical protein KF795_20420 [Labilithrix sp.]|nr:hypothetical protein [Labilithrix sp.]MBX3222889.1 hypothetical protein [Labilithrix sp.]